MTNEQKRIITKQYRKDLYDGDMLFHTLSHEHIAKNHVNNIWPSTMDRILTQNKHANSVFASTKIMNDSIESVLDTYMPDIIAWVYDKNANPEFVIKDTPYLEYNLDDEENQKPIGSGFIRKQNKIYEYNTPSVCIVLQKTNNEYGFCIKTVYPDLDCEDAKPTGRDLTEIMKNTPTYKMADTLYRKDLLTMVKPTTRRIPELSQQTSFIDDLEYS